MIIDFHCHYNPEFFRYREYRMDVDALAGIMDRHGITQAMHSPAGEFAAFGTWRKLRRQFRIATSSAQSSERMRCG